MQPSGADDSVADRNDSWWRSQALALAVELSSVRGQYETELSKLRTESGEAISWLEEKLAEEKVRSRYSLDSLRRWLGRRGNR